MLSADDVVGAGGMVIEEVVPRNDGGRQLRRVRDNGGGEFRLVERRPNGARRFDRLFHRMLEHSGRLSQRLSNRAPIGLQALRPHIAIEATEECSSAAAGSVL